MVAHTIDRVREFTCWPDAALMVADDGSTDGTIEMLQDKQVGFVSGVNMGVAWNKNRALFLLAQRLRCDTVILLEDDAHPSRHGWEREWIAAAAQWGHVNYGAHWMKDHIESGSGTASDPYISRNVTAQCAAYSSLALTYAGYFHPRFRGWGHEHVEHSRRLVRLGYGGQDERGPDGDKVRYRLITGHVTAVFCQSHSTPEKEEENLRVAREVMGNWAYRAPWETDAERIQFHDEVETVLRDGPERFRLTPPLSLTWPQACGVLDRLS